MFPWFHRSLRPAAIALVLFAGSLFAADAPATAPGQAKKLLFWKAASPTTEVYLLGSIHVGSKEFYPLPPEIMAAYRDSKALMVELDINKVDQAKMLGIVMQKGMYPPGDSLDKHLSPKTLEQFKAFCAQAGVPFEIVATMKPGMAMTTVMALVLQKIGYSPDLGVDKHLLDQAGKDGKRIIELENIEEQLDLLLGMDDAMAEESTADDLQRNTPEMLRKLVKDWQNGDAEAIEKLVLDAGETPASKALMDKAIYQRNDKMTQRVTELLKGTEKVFVTVGAGHLLGDRGIVKQLEKGGFTITRPDVTVAPATAPAAR